MEVEQRLRNALHEGATHVDMHGRGSAAAQRRGRRLVHRRRAVPAAATAAMVGATAFVVWPRSSNDQRDKVAVGAVGASPAAPAGADRFDWRAEPATVVQQRAVFVGSDGAFYALATAPGTPSQNYPAGGAPQALYRSTDGANWTPTALGEKPWIIDLEERDGVLYALGTAPGPADSIVPRVGTSSDGGATWQDAALPSAATPPAGATVALETSSVRPHLAVSGDTLVATLRTEYWFDIEAFVTDAERDAGVYASTGADGVEIYGLDEEAAADPENQCFRRESTQGSVFFADPPATIVPSDAPVPEAAVAEIQSKLDAARGVACAPKIVRTIPWSELGLSSIDDLTVNESFVSTDGQTWHATSLPFGPSDMVEVTAVPDGFLATATTFDAEGQVAEVKIARSSDGETWQSDDGAAAVGQLSYAGVVGARVVAVESNGGLGAHVVTSDDGGRTWNETDLGALVTDGNADEVYVGAFDTGPLGVALTVSMPGGERDSQFLLTSPDGSSWTVTPLTTIADASGTVISEPPYVDWVAVGADDLVLTVTQAGSDKHRQASTTFVGTPVA